MVVPPTNVRPISREEDGERTTTMTTMTTTTAKDTSSIVVVDFEGPDDPSDPRNFPVWRKVIMSIAVIVASLAVLSDGTLFTVAHEEIAKEFNIDESTFSHTYWPITTWGVGAAIFALFLLPLAEDFGIYPTFLGSWALMIISVIPQAVARNFATIIVTRFFAGGFITVIANSAVSVLIGLWPDTRTCGVIVACWMIAYMAGGSIGPVLGAAIYDFLDWRWTFYIQLIYYGIMFPILALTLKEVRVPAILRAKARALRKKGINARTKLEMQQHKTSLYMTIRRPLFMLCTEPVVLVICTWSAFMMGLTYVFTQSTEQVFVKLYGWTPVQAGYVQISIVIGEMLGFVGVLVNNHLYFKSASRSEDGAPIPEVRLYTAVPGGLIVTSGIFIYAWTSYQNIPWIAPVIGLTLSGMGVTIVLNSLVDYMVDSYLLYAASAMGAMALGENLSIAFLPLATQPMYSHLGFNWASSLLAFISLALTSISILIIFNGKRLRQRSPFIVEAYMALQAQQYSSVTTSICKEEEKPISVHAVV